MATTRKVTFSCQSEAGRAPTLGHLTAVLLFFPSKPEQPTCMCHFCVWGIGSIHRSCSPPPQVYSASSCNVQLCTLYQPTMHHLPGDACTCDSEKHKVHTLAIKYAVCITLQGAVCILTYTCSCFLLLSCFSFLFFILARTKH